MRFGRLGRIALGLAAAEFLIIAVPLRQVGAQQDRLPNSISLSVIVVDSAGTADQVLARLKNGEDFGAIAKEQSIDPTANDSGLMGTLDPSRLRIELRNALRGVGPGRVTAVVQIPEGFAILKVLPDAAVPGNIATNPIRILPLLATGAVKYTLAVSGRDEAESIFQALPRTEHLVQDLPAICKSRKDSLARVMGQLEEKLNPADPQEAAKQPPSERIKMNYTSAQLYAYKGEMEKAIERWQTA